MNMNNQEKNAYVRTQILKTLLEMMQEQSFDSIVISTLVKRAEVGRASFYRNFTDLRDVLKQESDRLIKGWDGCFKMDGTDNFSEELAGLLDHLKKNETFYLNVYKAGMEDVVKDTIISLFPISEDFPNALAYTYSFIAYSVYGWIHEWIRRGMQESGTELALMIAASQQKNN
ncbi:MAG: TetR/AcrR family transcriptional regulator [Lachnospiraceae bacterium]|nr:TetR/AcrR family transcriptional regulator [Lachnospiraceae bacterium]